MSNITLGRKDATHSSSWIAQIEVFLEWITKDADNVNIRSITIFLCIVLWGILVNLVIKNYYQIYLLSSLIQPTLLVYHIENQILCYVLEKKAKWLTDLALGAFRLMVETDW